MRIRVGIGLVLLFALPAAVGACTATESVSTSVSHAAGELAGVRIDVHEAPD
jgi:hypothetical protein